MLSYVAHYKNKFPGARVEFSEENLNVYSSAGALLVSLSRGGGGVLVDQGKMLGALYEHCLAPIPKNARVHKLTADNKIALDELHAERTLVAKELTSIYGMVPSIAALKKSGCEFEGDTVVTVPRVEEKAAPAKAPLAVVAEPDQDLGDQ
jgi:hypothetical protein